MFRRNKIILDQCRITPKRNPDKKALVKNALRISKNIRYTIDNSDDRDTHRWISEKRIRAMAKSIEGALNKNRLTTKINPKSAAEFVAKMKELEPRLYWEKMTYIKTIENYKEHYDAFFENEVEQMPGYLKGEYEAALRNDGQSLEANSGVPEEFNPENLYWEQTMKTNSEEQAKLLALQSRMRKIIESRLMEDE